MKLGAHVVPLRETQPLHFFLICGNQSNHCGGRVNLRGGRGINTAESKVLKFYAVYSIDRRKLCKFRDNVFIECKTRGLPREIFAVGISSELLELTN
jgi:hypothetical protein